MINQTDFFHVLILGNEANLANRLRTLPVPNGMTIDFESRVGVNRFPVADLVICDGVTALADEYLPGPIAESLERILCEQPEKLSDGTLKNLQWTAVWPQPMTNELLEFQFRQALYSVQRRKALEKTEIYLNTLIDSIPDLIWFKDLRGAHLKVNEAFCNAVGKTKVQCEGRGHYYIWDLKPDEYANGEYVCLETEEEVIRKRKTCLFDEKVKSKHGLRQFKTYKSPLFNQYHEIFGTVGIAKDVTDIQNVGRELEVVLSGIPFATLIADEKSAIVSINQKFCEYFSVTPEQILNMSYDDVCRDILGAKPKRLESDDLVELSFEHDKKKRVFRAQQKSIHDIFGNHFGTFFLCFDVTNEYDLQCKLLHGANTDFLTDLFNRRYFYEIANRFIGLETISLVYFDLDNFKQVNDTHGHQAGDQALLLMATLLRTAFPHELIARLGGDEFLVAQFGGCDIFSLSQRVEAFILHAGTVFSSTENMEALSVSAGIASGKEENDVDILLSHADKALYSAKSLGKSRYIVYEDHLEASLRT